MMNNKVLRFFILLLLLVGIVFAVMNRHHFDTAALESWVQGAGSAGPFLFMLIYIVGTVFFLPGSVLTLLGGALFGPYWGTFYNLTGATIGAMLSFLISRYLASDWVANKTGGKIKQLVNGVESEGWHFVAFTRLVPLFPFNLLNYALGLTKISFTQYSLASWICMLPGAIAYTYLGYASKEAISGGEDTIQKIMLAIALLAVVGFLPRLIGKLRSKPMMIIPELHKRQASGEDLLILDVRTAEDYVGEQGHIAGSMLLPLEELEQRIHELDDYLEKTIVTICRTDRKSLQAEKILTQHGFADVHVAKMGMTGWNKNGFSVE
ncbi:MAG: sulfurtransferase [Gammaproteobacteria bacterium]|nr:sulfurtransferase [Gammaproteobacteria bacterium]